jgi:hypothetical protein
MLDSAAVALVKTRIPKLTPEEGGGWREHYVSKDVV